VGATSDEEFREFVNARGRALLRVALALTGNHHAAEDLLQHALERTFARWSRIGSDPEAYVRTAMYHTQVSLWRRRRRVREVSVERTPDRADTRDDMYVTDQRMAVREALGRLGPRQRAVLVARFLEDLSEEQTAELLGCTTGTVRSQTHRALNRLRQLAPELRAVDLTREGIS
jgi:RNA polymerase sigma-70 factor (sigma-E family)